MSPNGGESGDWVAYLVADEIPPLAEELLALLEAGALIEEEKPCETRGRFTAA